MSLQMDALREKMSVHLHEMMEDGETFRWPVARAYHMAWYGSITLSKAEPHGMMSPLGSSYNMHLCAQDSS